MTWREVAGAIARSCRRHWCELLKVVGSFRARSMRHSRRSWRISSVAHHLGVAGGTAHSSWRYGQLASLLRLVELTLEDDDLARRSWTSALWISLGRIRLSLLDGRYG